MLRAYEAVIQVIKDNTDGKKEENNAIDYYEAVRCLYRKLLHAKIYRRDKRC